MSQYHLGEFEEIVLLAVAILNGKAYGVSIIEEIESRLNRNVSLGAMQTVLKRLEDKGLVQSEFGEATKVRGGKRKRLYEITFLSCAKLKFREVFSNCDKSFQIGFFWECFWHLICVFLDAQSLPCWFKHIVLIDFDDCFRFDFLSFCLVDNFNFCF